MDESDNYIDNFINLMHTQDEQQTLVDQLTSFLKTFKLTLSAKIHLFYSIITREDTKNLIQKVIAREKEYKHEAISSVDLTAQTTKVVERFCMRISEFLQYRFCALKNLKLQWLTSEIALFQGSLKKIFSQVKVIKKPNIIAERLVDCRNIFARNVLEQIIKNKYLATDSVKEIRNLFKQKLYQRMPLQYKGTDESESIRHTFSTQQIQNNPFVLSKTGEAQKITSLRNIPATYRQKKSSVARIVTDLVQNDKTNMKKGLGGVRLEKMKTNHSAWSSSSLPSNQNGDTLAKESPQREEGSPKLPMLKSKISDRQDSQKNILKTNPTVRSLSKQEYFDCLKKAMDLEDPYWVYSSNYATNIRQLTGLNRKNQAAIMKFTNKYKRSIFKAKVTSPESIQRATKLQKESPITPLQKPPTASRKQIHNSSHKQSFALLQHQNIRAAINRNKIRTVTNNPVKVQEAQLPKINLLTEENLPFIQFQKRIKSVIN